MNQMQKIHLQKYGVGFNSWYELNSVKPHIANETWKHFLLKCIICYQLNKEGKDFFTEVPIKGNKKPDIINFSDRIAYEIETKAKNFRTWYDEKSGFQFYELPVDKTIKLFLKKDGVKNRKRTTIRRQSNRTKSTR